MVPAHEVGLEGEGTPLSVNYTPLQKDALAHDASKFHRCAVAPHPIWPGVA